MAHHKPNLHRGAQTAFEPKPELERNDPMVFAFHQALRRGAVLLPDLRVVEIQHDDLSFATAEDAWVDHAEVMLDPEYEQRCACLIETIVNAGLVDTRRRRVASGSQRFNFVPQNLSVERATGELFGLRNLFWERDAEAVDWRKERTICDSFTTYPNRYMNRLKERIYAPRTQELQKRDDDALLLRLGYLGLAIKVFLARAGYTEFCQQELPRS